MTAKLMQRTRWVIGLSSCLHHNAHSIVQDVANAVINECKKHQLDFAVFAKEEEFKTVMAVASEYLTLHVVEGFQSVHHSCGT